ncbi:hypothetical protein AK812_SmicGene46568 [Symbiodinium microadriaticum]|uniref:Uncharacterized protein n=1 Tax=Symbiodinium microadriaticum TaxID=2951 RepID=A0A1Q9BTL0_SYMMI|nr:hypothetical protein AK812_SmicGene46568 [Symbiodinium microadriaticum]CAE7271838.1 unnamed protein product [Symbiodinium microadriaticum]CAE7417300.1 unnamed protein product [Symbiodinium sp. KB8]
MASGGGQIGEIFILASSQQRTLPHKVDGRWIKSFGLDVRPWLHDDPAESGRGQTGLDESILFASDTMRDVAEACYSSLAAVQPSSTVRPIPEAKHLLRPEMLMIIPPPEEGQRVGVHLWCTAGVHRSVGTAVWLYSFILQLMPILSLH